MNHARFRLERREQYAYVVFLLALFILSMRAVVGLHEVLGHAALEHLFGAVHSSSYIQLFGGGHVFDVIRSRPQTWWEVRFIALGGIGFNFVSGAIVLWFLRHRSSTSAFTHFLQLFGSFSFCGAIGYLVSGFYYDTGDPAILITADGPPAWAYWLPSLALAPITAYIASCTYFRLQERIFPAPTLATRLQIVVRTFGIAAIAYMVLLLVFDDAGFAGTRGPVYARNRARQKAVQLKRNARAQELKTQRPELDHVQIQRQVRDEHITASPAEVAEHEPWNIFPLLIGGYLLGIIAAARTTPLAEPASKVTGIPRSAPITVVCLALSALAYLYVCDGIILRW